MAPSSAIQLQNTSQGNRNQITSHALGNGLWKEVTHNSSSAQKQTQTLMKFPGLSMSGKATKLKIKSAHVKPEEDFKLKLVYGV